MNNSSCGCTSCGSGCCSAGSIETETRKVVVDFLYLDLSVCEWCQGTEKNLEKAIASISNVLELAGIEVVLNKINVNTEELAIKHKFAASPTIRVDGRDIQMETRERRCDSCGDLCGDEVNCRVWVYKSQEYTVPPVALIAEELLRSIFGHEDEWKEDTEYVLPENLKKFYEAMKNKDRCCNGDTNNEKI